MYAGGIEGPASQELYASQLGKLVVGGFQALPQIKTPALIVEVLRVDSFTWYLNSESCRSIPTSLKEGDHCGWLSPGAFNAFQCPERPCQVLEVSI
ncbi:hypothetical protein BJX68DRAFT_250823 [Aspergillus pseudodeflectus]|uniref:Uncharacterized protein n=1 Tax=Aspergillus pseudodeflectus TaxID=176178 RepID=A0ABR4J8B1_9EURO